MLALALVGGAAFMPSHAPQLAACRTEGTAVLPHRALPTASITGRDGVMTEAIRDGVITEDGVMTEAIRDGVMTEAIRDEFIRDEFIRDLQVRGPGTWPRCLEGTPPWPRCLAGIPGMAWFLHRDTGTEGQPGVHPNEIRPHQVPLATPVHTRITFNVCSPHAGDPEYR